MSELQATFSHPATLSASAMSGARPVQWRDMAAQPAEAAPPGGVGQLLGVIWRRKLLFLLVFALALGAAVMIVMGLKPSYRSEALVMIDTRQTHFIDAPAVTDSAAQSGDLNYVRSEQSVLGSDELARRVVKDLHLDRDPDLAPLEPKVGILGEITGLFGEKPPNLTPQERFEEAIANYSQRLGVFSDGKSFVIQVSFSHSDPAIAQKIVDTHLKIYMDRQRQAKMATIGRAAAWLDTQLAELSDKVRDSDRQLAQYREANHLVRSDGQTISGRQLATVTAQLARARSDLAQRSARAEGLGGGGDSAMQNSELVHRLREQEATQAAAVASLSSRYGNNYPPLVEARSAMAVTQNRISSELGRSVSSAQSDSSISRSEVARLEAEVNGLETRAASADQAEVEAAQISSAADANRRLYESLLARSKQIAIQQEIQEPDARVVSSASTPSAPAFPKRGLLIAISAAVAAVLAGAVAFIADQMRGPSQSVRDVEALCGLSGLGVVPHMRRGWYRRSRDNGAPLPPRSMEAAAIQAVGNSLALQAPGRPPRVVALTSALPGEGKSTVVALLGRNLVTMGQRVLVIDADLRRRGLTRTLGVRSSVGLVGVVAEGHDLASSVVRVAGLEFDLLPVEKIAADPHRLLHLDRMHQVLDEARGRYDVVLIDTPPLAAVDDALAVVSQADATVLVVRHGRTPNAAITGALRRLLMTDTRVAGFVMNDMRAVAATSSAGELAAFRPMSNSYYSGHA